MFARRALRLRCSFGLIGLAGACAEHAPANTRMAAGDLPADAAAAFGPARSAVDAAVLEPSSNTPEQSSPDRADATAPDAADAAPDDTPVGACGPFARLPGAVGFTGAPCGRVVPWVSPTFVYEGKRSAGPAQAVPLKGGDGIIVAAHFSSGAPPTFRTVFARVDEAGDCQELIDQVEDDDDRHYVSQARASERGSVLMTACGYGFCGPSLRLSGRAPYDLLHDIGIDAYLGPTKSPPQLFQRIVSTRDSRILVATSLAFDSHDPNRPPELSRQLMLRTLSPELTLLGSEAIVADGAVNDVALTDDGELLVLVDRANEAASHYLYRFGPGLEEKSQVYMEARNFDRVTLEAAFGRVAFALNRIVVLDTRTYAPSPFMSQVRPSSRFAAFELFQDGRLLFGDSNALSLYGPDGTAFWSQLVPAPPADSTSSKSVIQTESSGRILFSARGQLTCYCEP